ncbi:ATP-binding protein [Pseudomonas juntendi]|uniref:ATP-binding protein n=1 Tax=Pseudomonas mosselii TaxID=78327 RepID=A0ABX9B7K6_9PSED|nr:MULTISPECIES: ATP-binding protein [Pseudomonas]MBH3384003.1 ATP-binding protein [Pseudomonas juntendi]OAS08543.1 ATPase [Pseudomonas putida]PYC04916.1 AAA family ATPase [Pseudomonas sp. MB-090624]QZP28735.1 ATP-binding protein [Pseudomonas mosselii]
MSTTSVFDSAIELPDIQLTDREKVLLGFAGRYERVQNQLQLLLNQGQLSEWSKQHHKSVLPICNLVADQYPLVIFHGDVGTGKTATAECIANRIVRDSRAEDSVLFKLSNRVRGSGKVGEMGTLLTQAFAEVAEAAGKKRRAILIIDEGDSIAASRSQSQSHHEDKVAVNTLIQGVDELRKYGGRIVVILCTNRLSVLDAALRRRAAIVEEFTRPDAAERKELFSMDLAGMGLSDKQLTDLATVTGERNGQPAWTYSDIRTRLYPMAMAKAFPNRPLDFKDLTESILSMRPSPVMEDK